MARNKDIDLTFEDVNLTNDEKPEKLQAKSVQAEKAMAEPTESESEESEKPETKDEKKNNLKEALKKIKENVHEDDPRPAQALTFRSILGGDILTGEMVRSHIWLFVFIVVIATAYVGIRYQCQQDVIAIDRLNNELTDAKYKASASSSTLTEKCRESHVLEILKQNRDSLLHIADQPPYIIYVPE